LTNAHASQEDEVELGVDSTIEITAGRWDATAPLERSDVLGRTPEQSGRLADVNYAVHNGRA